MDVDSAREDTRDVLEVSGEIQEKPSGCQGDRDWHYDEERYEDADHFSAVERRELYRSYTPLLPMSHGGRMTGGGPAPPREPSYTVSD